MSNTAVQQASSHDEDWNRTELAQIGGALVQLEAWTRARGYDDLAALIDQACDWTDTALTT